MPKGVSLVTKLFQKCTLVDDILNKRVADELGKM